MKYSKEEFEKRLFQQLWGQDLREREDAEAFTKRLTPLILNAFKNHEIEVEG